MKSKVFDNGLVVKHRKSAIIFENDAGKKEKDTKFSYNFTHEGFITFAHYIEEIAHEAWSSIIPKEAHSAGSDYNEYYDRTYDDNGYLSLGSTDIVITAPYWSVDTLYQFNKPKIQSFLYDLQRKIEKLNERMP